MFTVDVKQQHNKNTNLKLDIIKKDDYHVETDCQVKLYKNYNTNHTTISPLLEPSHL